MIRHGSSLNQQHEHVMPWNLRGKIRRFIEGINPHPVNLKMYRSRIADFDCKMDSDILLIPATGFAVKDSSKPLPSIYRQWKL